MSRINDLVCIRSLRCLCLFMLAFLNTTYAQIITPDLQRTAPWPQHIVLQDSIDVKNVVKDYRKLLANYSDSSKKLLEYIIDKCITVNLTRETGWAYAHLANIERRSGMYFPAIQTALYALDFCRQHNETSYIADIYNTIGMSYFALGSFDMATKNLLKSVEMIEKYPLSTMKIPTAYNNLASVMPSESQQLNYFDKAYDKAKEIGDTASMGIALQNKSVVYTNMELYKNADEAAQLSLELGLQSRDISLQYNAHMRYCYNYLKRGMPENALMHVLQAGKLMEGTRHDIVQANLQRMMTGETYAHLKNYDSAGYFLHGALEVARNHSNMVHEVAIYNYLAKMYEEKGDYHNALKYQKEYVRLNDSILNGKISRDISSMEVWYRTEEKEKELQARNMEVRQKNFLIAGIVCVAGLLSGIFLLFYRDVRRKQKMGAQEREIVRLKAAMEGEEQERIRIARELHDGIMVQFSSVKMHLGSVLRRMGANLHSEELNGVVTQLDNATRELRRSAHNLMPDTLLEEGLYGAVAYFCSSLRKSSGVEITFQQYGDVPDIHPDYELMLYRIIQELVHNALKYARANYIVVQLDCDNTLFGITVEDDGIGLDTEKVNSGSGLKNIRSRIELLNGVMTILSSKDAGTTIYVELDITQLKKGNESAYIRSYS